MGHKLILHICKLPDSLYSALLFMVYCPGVILYSYVSKKCASVDHKFWASRTLAGTKRLIYPPPWIPLFLSCCLGVPGGFEVQSHHVVIDEGHWFLEAQVAIPYPKQELGQSLPGVVCEGSIILHGATFRGIGGQSPVFHSWKRVPWARDF